MRMPETCRFYGVWGHSLSPQPDRVCAKRGCIGRNALI